MDHLWRFAEATFSWEGQDDAVQTPPSPGSESGDDPALDSDRGDRSDSGDSDGEAQGQVFENNRPTRARRPPQWLRNYIEI